MKKIAFVISEIKLHEQLSIMSLSSCLKAAGHQTSLVYFQNDPLSSKKIVKSLVQEQPDFIALSFMSCDKEHYLRLAREIRQAIDAPIIVGGPAVTFDLSFKDYLGDPIDAICIGEGDKAIVEFVDRYQKGSTDQPFSNFIYRDPKGTLVEGGLMDLVDPLDQLPFPDRAIIYENDAFLKDSKIKMFMSGRGCPYQCTYCFNHKYNRMYKGKGRVIRHKSVDYFLEEIERVRKDYPLEGIIFEDDIFVINKQWLEEFAPKYRARVNLPYMCYVRPNLVDADIARLLKESGCYSARVAIECGNEVLRNKILKRNLSDKQIVTCCDTLHKAGLKVGTINILGLPTETIENMKETMELNKACSPDQVSTNMFMPLPGVDLTFYAIEHGLLDEQFSSPKSSHHVSNVKYPEDVKKFLYPFKTLFSYMVMNAHADKYVPVLMKLPNGVLKIFDSLYRLRRNSKFYPKVNFSLRNKLRALRRYINIVRNH